MAEQRDLLGEVTSDELQQLLDADADLPESERRWPPMLVDLLRVLEAVQLRDGVKPEQAFANACAAAMALAEYFGGRPLYIPRGDRLGNALRDAKIFRTARQGNFDQLAQEYGLTVIQVYRIFRTQRKLHLRKMQGRLFE